MPSVRVINTNAALRYQPDATLPIVTLPSLNILFVEGPDQSNDIGLMDAAAMGLDAQFDGVTIRRKCALLALNGSNQIAWNEEGPFTLRPRESNLGGGSFVIGTGGFELKMMRELAAAFPQHNFFVHQQAIDGSGYHDHWNDPAWPPGGPSSALVQIGDDVVARIAEWDIDLVIFGAPGGERDSGQTPDSGNVRPNLDAIYSYLRGRVAAAGVSLDVHVLLWRLSHHSNSGGSSPEAIAGQEGFCAASSLNHIINCNAYSFRGDNVHYSDASFVQGGTDGALVVADILNGTIPAHPVCLGTGNFASGSAAQSATVNFPKFYKPGDRLGLSYNGVGNTAPSFVANDPGDTGTGFVEVANSPQKDPSSALNARLHVYTFVVPAGRGSDAPNTPLNAVTFNNPAGDDSWIVECTNFGPCEVEATFGSATNTNSTSVLMPAGSTSGDNRLIAQYISHKPSAAITATPPGQVTSWANSDLTKIEEQYDVATTLGTDHGAALMTGVKATEGDFQASTATLVTSATQARLVVVLRKAA